MSKEVNKTARKTYAKPLIAVEDFVLNQFIAANCRMSVETALKAKTNGLDSLSLDPFTKSVIAVSFNDTNSCQMSVDDANDTYCYHTGVRTLVNS